MGSVPQRRYNLELGTGVPGALRSVDRIPWDNTMLRAKGSQPLISRSLSG